VRGGAWTSYDLYMAATYRLTQPTEGIQGNGGFRVASPVGAVAFPAAAPPPAPSPGGAEPAPPQAPGGALVALEMVPVGDAGNAADPVTELGAVPYEYRIGKFMVTIAQYTAFLNAVAKNDTHALYHPGMTADLISAGIARAGAPGAYIYSVMDNAGNSGARPIAYVSWFDAARMANWMANGQPEGVQGPATTEDGAYALAGATAGAAPAPNAVNPNTGEAPAFRVPSEDEWYKAAYFSAALAGGAGGYFLLPAGSNAYAGNQPGGPPSSFNVIGTDKAYATTQSANFSSTQNYLTDVGAYAASPSPYGTFDQGGLLWEWNDLASAPGTSRGLRGACWGSAGSPLNAKVTSTASAAREYNDAGFRLAGPALAAAPGAPAPAASGGRARAAAAAPLVALTACALAL
jgi:formylglycine-generating enzyme required for sulfatase activity